MAGTGGTSMGRALAAGAHVVSAGGSVATTDVTRAIAMAAALAGHFRLPHLPLARAALSPDVPLAVLAASLPVFLSLTVADGLSAAAGGGGGGGGGGSVDAAAVLAVTVCAAAAAQTSRLGETGMLAGTCPHARGAALRARRRARAVLRATVPPAGQSQRAYRLCSGAMRRCAHILN